MLGTITRRSASTHTVKALIETNQTAFDQIMTQDPNLLTDGERAFLDRHRQIISCGNMAGAYFIELARNLKQMKDEKLYQAAGFAEFGEYVETAVGLKQRQAYNYIRVAEKYSEEYLLSHAGMGVTKLSYLSALTDSEREVLEEHIDLKKSSAQEVNEAVQAAIRERDEKQRQLEVVREENEDLKTELTENEAARESLQRAYETKKSELFDARKTVAELERQRDELKLALKEESEKKAVVTVPDESAKKEAEAQKKRASELEERLRETEKRLAEAQKKTAATDRIWEFDLRFRMFRKKGKELIELVGSLDEDFALKCKNAIKAEADELLTLLGFCN